MQSNLVDVDTRSSPLRLGRTSVLPGAGLCDCLTHPLPPQNCPILSGEKKKKNNPGTVP